MRALPVAATVFLGLTLSAAAQMLGPGIGGNNMPNFDTAPPAPPPGTQGPRPQQQQQQQQQQQMPPCFQEFTPLRQEAEKRANTLKAAMQKKAGREEACNLIKRFSEAEAKVVKYVSANAKTCGIPADAVKTMRINHERTAKMETQVCNGAAAAGPAKPTGPGLSEALGTTRSGTLDPFAPQSGALDTLTGNVLTK